MIDKILAAIAVLALLIVVGAIGYNEMFLKNVEMIVNLKENEDPFVAIKQIIPNDSTLIEIKEIDKSKNEYILTVSTKREKANLLEWMKLSHKVEKVEILSKLLSDKYQDLNMFVPY